MKRTRTVVIAFLTVLAIILSAVCGSALTNDNKLFGDLDGDDTITAADALLVLRYSVKLEEYNDAQLLLSDVDSDGSITAADALDILRYSVNLTVETKVGKNFDNEDYPQDSDTTTDTNTDTEESTDIESTSKTLVAYFSRTGNTEAVAQYIIELTGADSFVIEAALPYSDEDIAYNTDCRANREQNDKTVRPEIAGKVENMQQYDTIYLGYPIWWGQEPRIIDTFLESYDFSGTTIIPFCTSASSGISQSVTNISVLNIEVGELNRGRRFSIGSEKDEVKEWLDSLFPIEDNNMIYVHIGENTLEVKLSDNSSAKAFRELLEKGDLTIEMHDYGSFEKVGSIGTDLPRNDEYITTEPGDLILYQGNQITIYYDVNSWNFTRLGRVQGLSQQELKEVLGSSDVTAVFSVEP